MGDGSLTPRLQPTVGGVRFASPQFDVREQHVSIALHLHVTVCVGQIEDLLRAQARLLEPALVRGDLAVEMGEPRIHLLVHLLAGRLGRLGEPSVRRSRVAGVRFQASKAHQ